MVGIEAPMTIRQRRLVLILTILFSVGTAVGLTLRGLNENISFYRTPTQLLAETNLGQTYRIGGMVVAGSVTRGAVNSFRLTDTTTELPVQYGGALPDLFREGQGLVVEGHLQLDGTLIATQVLAKHDERYMPPEAARAMLKAQEK